MPVDLTSTSHRPWAYPTRSWAMAQTWNHLLFAHWPLSPDVLRPLIPSGLELDLFNGQAWLGVVPFYMTGVRFRMMPPIPPTGNFAELNVRTYVVRDGRPGVWFFSLDAASRMAVETARVFFYLPYFYAQMQVKLDGETVHYHSERRDRRGGAGVFRGRYWPTSPVYASKPGTLDHWLTERYCLYAASGERLYRADIHHTPWPLQHAEAEIEVNTVAELHGIHLPDVPPLLHYSQRIDVAAWYVERLFQQKTL